MSRPLASFVILIATITTAENAWTQTAAPPRVGSEISVGNAGLRPNASGTSKPIAMTNKIIKPVPLTADSQRNALKNIDRNISSQLEALSDKLKTVLPDELSILSKTNGWKTEDQQALVSALRAGDRTAVYEA